MSFPPWPVENIPDSDLLYMRAHKQHFDGAELLPGVFRPQGNSISVDWNKYAKPEQTQLRAVRNPFRNSIISLNAGKIRVVPPMSVIHDPINDPADPGYPWRAHSGLMNLPEDGELKTEVRLRLLDAVVDTPIMFSE